MGTRARSEPAAVDPDTLYTAFGDRTRRRILHLLLDGEECVGDLVGVLGLPQPAVSRHLAYLRRAGLVRFRRVGTWAFYALVEPVDEVHRGLLATLAAAVPEGAADLERARALRAEGGCCPQHPREETR
jgi:ArsR family transcriptional regulator